ncbi:MAG: hypothetical protein OEU98_01465, partial [Actinomycetota bacterium]|nr:hypothetical protein [Actinomycetota bacterium]
MSNDYLLLVAAYQDPETADEEFDALAAKVRVKEIRAQGMILVAKDPDGTVNVKDTGDKAGRKGAMWGSGVGLLVGLASPVLLGSVVVGAAG